ncbi:MAG: 50S ribosomal protein L9 [Candidatus Cloacimonetes bacterium]|nr:50S ribosomal protein L9 [Candidatus Cloacimonadota bacterium]
MKVILIKDIKTLGHAGDVVKVADGYGRNYLLPKKFVIPATKFNLNKVQKIKDIAVEEKLAVTNEFKLLAEKINDLQLVFNRKSDENGHLFGSVSENDIIHEMKKKGFEIHKSNVLIEKSLKETGNYQVKIHFTSEIEAMINVLIEEE